MKKQFKSESKKLLDLMINSIYTNKDIFLRELVSNSSDALDKLYYKSLTDKKINISKDELEIFIDFNKDKKELIIKDNGIGMDSDELEKNLGTIAKSGSEVFKEIDNKDINIIGMFGVGFYSAFMVSDKITVISKSINSNKAYKWISSGVDGYTINECDYDLVGTKIILHLKEDNDDFKYSDYLTEYKIRELIKKYSDYIRYPIKIKNSSNEVEVLNSMIPLWKKNKKDIKEDEVNNFYQEKYYDYEKPLKVINTSVEGALTYKSLLFIPSHAPYDFYTKDYEKGLSLYSNGVLIMDKCSDLLPDYLSFVKGVVDTEDVSLNISREMLQKTKTVHLIAKNIETKILKELSEMLKNDRETYEKFYKAFGMQIKFGIYNNYGIDKDKLKDLLLFTSSKTKKYITLKEYISNMKKSENIYYVSGESINMIDSLPQVEKVKDKGYEILYLTDYVDEFVINVLVEYDNKKFINVASSNLDLNTKEEKEEVEKINKSNNDMLNSMKELLDVHDVKITNQLKNHPVCLVSDGDISIEMEKVINSMPTDENIKAKTILEINKDHPIVSKLKDLYKNDKEKFEKYSKILYSQARLIEGLPVDNQTEISNLICEVISK